MVVQRFGNVLHWAGCAVAVLFLLGDVVIGAAFFDLFGNGILDPTDVIASASFCTVLAVICWSLGRASKYILAGT